MLLTGKETVLIDAGIGKKKIEEIDQARRIDILIISHSHPDHIRYWHLLHDRRILLPRETPEAVKDLQLLGERFTGTPENGAYWAKWVSGAFGVRALRDPDQRYTDGDILDLGGARLEAIRARGHTDDHYCFLDRKTGTLMTTDIDLTAFGPWYANPESDIALFQESIKKIMAIPYQRVCSSHRPPIEGDATVDFEAFLGHFEAHRTAIRDLCDPPTTVDRIVAASPIYENKLPNKVLQRIFETNMVVKNLQLLIRDGLVEERHGLYAKVGA